MIRTRLQGATPFFANMLNNGNVEVCLKEDVDKVIAEKDEEIYNIKYSRDEWAKACNQKDKVIAELKAQKSQAEDDCAYWKMSEGNAATAMHETEEYSMQLYNELRHQKFKRCLAMARCCYNESLWWYSKGYGFEKYDKFWEKWEKRWLELAEKFKEAK